MRSASSFSGRQIRASTSRSTGLVHDVSRRFLARLRRLPTNRHRTRHLLNQEFMQALLLNFRHEGKKAIEKVARNQPAVYVKILTLLVPREMHEQSGGVKAMSDEQLERSIELIKEPLAKWEAGGNAKPVRTRKPRRERKSRTQRVLENVPVPMQQDRE